MRRILRWIVIMLVVGALFSYFSSPSKMAATFSSVSGEPLD